MSKEKLTNNTSVVVEKARKQLFLSKSPDETIVFYAKLPHFADETSFFLLKDANQVYYVEKKIWHKTRFFQENTLGIYNLDRLHIETEVFVISSQEIQKQINEFLAHFYQLNCYDIKNDFTKQSLVLDGETHILKIFYQNISFEAIWYVIPEHSDKVIDFIKKFLFLWDKYFS